MGQLLKHPTIEMIEPIATPTIEAEGVGLATRVGDKVHMVLYTNYVGVDGIPQHRVAGRVVMKADPLQHNSFLISQAVLAELSEEAHASI